jgi:hypothetical protein
MNIKIMFYASTLITFLIGVVMSVLIAIQGRWVGYAHWIFIALTLVGTIWLLVKSYGKL